MVAVETIQFAIGAFIVVALLVVVVALRWHNSYVGLPEDQQRRKAELRGQLEALTPGTVRIPGSESLSDHRDAIDATFDGPESAPDRVTVRDAVGSVHHALTNTLRDRTKSLPRTAIALGEEAVLIAILGAIVFVPSSAVEQTGSVSDITLAGLVSGASDASQQLFESATAAAGAFPFADVWWAFAVLIVLEGGTLLYNHWFLTSLGLAVLAVGLVAVSRRVPDGVDRVVYGSAYGPALAAAGVMAVVYVVGVVPTALLGALGAPEIGAYVGLLAVMVTLLFFGYHALLDLDDRLRRVGRGADIDRETLAYVVLDRAGVAFGAVLAPIVLAYLVVAIVDGHLVEMVLALATGPLPVQLLTLGTVVLAAVLLGFGSREAYADVRAGLVESLSRQAVRSALLGRAMPVSVLVGMTILGLGIGAPAYVAVAIAVIVAAFARFGYVLAMRVRRRARAYDPPTSTASRLVVAGHTLDTGEDDVYYARVNTTAVAATDRERAVDAVIDVGEQLIEDGDVDPSIEQAFATDLLELGFADEVATIDRLRTTVREELVDAFDEYDGAVPEDEFEDRVDDVPEPVIQDRLRQWMRSQQVLRRDDQIYNV